MKSVPLLPVLALLLASSSAIAQTTPESPAAGAAAGAPKVLLTPVQTAHILKELEKVETVIGQGRGGLMGSALTKFRDGMASESAALALYLDCYKLENFDRKDLKQTDFMDWRDRNELRLKDNDFKKALLLQLEYLVLTIQAQEIKDVKKMGPLVASLQAFIAKAVTAVQESTKHTASGAVEPKDSGAKGGPGGGGGRKGGPGGGQGGGGGGPGGTVVGMLRQPVTDTEFAQAYLLEDYLKLEAWEYRPLDLDGIYSNVIFPYYLAEKPTELAGQWDARINAEMALQKALVSETEFNLYSKEEGPRLQWAKHNDLVSNNISPVISLAEMLKVIQGSPNHPDAAGWLTEFRDLVKSVSEPMPDAPPVEKPIGSQ